MRKLGVLLVVAIILLSCTKDEDCNCVEKIYQTIEQDSGVYAFEPYETNVIECVDEDMYLNDNNDLVIIRCY
jgi:hypothetical protein